MSGSVFSSGNMFNKGDIGSPKEKEKYFDLKISSATLYTMHLIENNRVGWLFTETPTIVVETYLPFINTPKARHYALGLKTIDDRIIIIEYGQYLNKNSERQSSGIFGSSSNKKCRESKNNNLYYYLLNDGARFYEIDAKEIIDNKRIALIIGANYYGISFEEVKKKTTDDFSFHQLNVGNEITLGELVNYFIKDNNWNAKDYNVLTHNCQDFASKCIKILKLTRMNDLDKVRVNEIQFFSPCVLRALYANEGWSAKNIGLRTLQRIPFFGNYFPSS